MGPKAPGETAKRKPPLRSAAKWAEAEDGGNIEMWGDGKQTRSFLFIDECVEGVRRLMESDCNEPLNIGSDKAVSLNELARTVMKVSGKQLGITNIEGPQGVRGRNSDNTLVEQRLGWRPDTNLEAGIEKTYRWIAEQVRAAARRSTSKD